MPLAPGSRLGPYEIDGTLGVGGMGEVYRATDPRLRRSVALKILPPELARNSERSARFEREAQALASLSHPNIVTIFSVESVAGTPFLTMELVEGQTLTRLIPPGGLAPQALIPLAHGIAEGMAAAHERGITHRDLKPGNVMVSRDGRVKILDFGLARVREAPVEPDRTTRLPSEALTADGRFVGTVAYMSPEQAQGKHVDPRSDIFSLGIVLHEMATGERPFKGETQMEVISSILRDDPPLISDVRPSHSVRLARIIRRCLQKDPSRRYQTATDLRNDLDDLSRNPEREKQPGSRPARRRAAMATGALGLIVAAAMGAWLVWPGGGGERPFAIGTVQRLTSDGQAELAAMSSDGRYVVHIKEGSGRPSLWLRHTATGSDVQIIPPDDVLYVVLSFSPDDNYVYFATYPITARETRIGRLFSVPVLGGSPQPILEDVDGGVDFSPSGDRLAFFRMDGLSQHLMIANADGSEPRTLATLGEGERVFLVSVKPAWSPDGRTILAAVLPKTGAELHAIEVATGKMRAVSGTWRGITGVAWMPDGRSVLLAAVDKPRDPYQIWQVDHSFERRTRVTNDLNTYSGLHVTNDGRTLATIQWNAVSQIWISNIDPPRSSRQLTTRTSLDGGLGLAWAPDGRIVFVSTRTARSVLWVMNADGSGQRALTDHGPAVQNPTVTPDGQFVVFEGSDQSGDRIWRMDLAGGSATAITPGPFDVDPVVSPDGWVYYMSQHPDRRGMHKVRVSGGQASYVHNAYPQDAVFDGRVLVLVSESGHQWEVAHGSVSDLQRVAGVPVLYHPLNRLRPVRVRFTDSGRAVLYGVTRSGVSNVWRKRLSGGTPEQITDFTSDRIFAFAQSHEGRRLAVARGTVHGDVVLIRQD